MKLLPFFIIITFVFLTHQKLPITNELGNKLSNIIKSKIHESTNTFLSEPIAPSEFIQWAFKQVNIIIPKSISSLSNMGQTIPFDSVMLGDVLFFNRNGLEIDTAGILIDTNTFAFIPSEGSAIIETDLSESKWVNSFVMAKRIQESNVIETLFELMDLPEITQSAFTTYVNPAGHHNYDPGYLRFYTQDISEADLLLTQSETDEYKQYGTNTNNPNMPLHEIKQAYIGCDKSYKRPLINKTSVEFVCIHDTGDNKLNATGWAKEVTTSDREVSWHFSVDENDIYQHIALKEVGYHAGDGTRFFNLTDTGVEYTIDNPVLEFNKEDNYLYINGIQSNITAPMYKNISYHDITPSGLYTENVTNHYYINSFYYNPTYQVVSNHGGNRNSIGIETCIYNGTTYSKTLRKTANLVAHLLNVYNLTTARVLQHRHFSGKTCPMSMIRATEGCTFDYKEFLALIELEYFIMKNMPGVKITYKSHDKDLLSNDGYFLKYVNNDTEVEYDVTVKFEGVTTKRTLKTIVHPNKGPEPLPKNAKFLKVGLWIALAVCSLVLIG